MAQRNRASPPRISGADYAWTDRDLPCTRFAGRPGSGPAGTRESRQALPCLRVEAIAMRPRLRTRREILSIVLTTASIAIGAVWAGGACGAAEWAGSPPASPATELEKSSDLVVHEWGTFLGMNGSDGACARRHVPRGARPAGVRAQPQPRPAPAADGMFIKGETPVIYFYTERPAAGPGRRRISRRGIWTQWYPAGAARSDPPCSSRPRSRIA